MSTGFTGATNLALAGDRIYVTELFAHRVTRLNTRNGALRTVAHMTAPAALERRGDTLYVTDLSDGTLRVLDPSGSTPPPTSPPFSAE